MNDNILEPMENRLDFFEIMQPEKGYFIDKIIVTTYSLDMDVLIGLLILLGASSEDIKGKSRVELLYILRNMKDKVLLFCQAGKIINPSKLEEKTFFSFLENVINPVKPNRRKSFHPKTYLIRYKEAGKKIYKYKFIVMSKNLTFSRNWDISIGLNGRLESTHQENSEPIYEFYKYLFNNLENYFNEKNLKDFEEMITEIKKVNFKSENLDIFNNIEFIPMGIEKKYTKLIQGEILDKKYKRGFIISPFLSSNIVEKIYKNGNDESERILVTREDSLNKLVKIKENISGLKIYKIKDEIITGEQDIQNNNVEVDIHAKMYLFELENGITEVFLGSANESSNAFLENGNIEFMVKLTTKRSLIDNLKQDLLYDQNGEKYFELVQIEGMEEKNLEEENYEEIINSIISLNIISEVIKYSEDNYKICLKIKENLMDLDKYDIKIYPLTKKEEAHQLLNKIEFNGLSLRELTQFFVVRINEQKEIIIKIPLDINILVEREKQLSNNLVETEEEFIEYISYLLGDTSSIYMMRNILKNSNSNKEGRGFLNIDGLYEKTLKVLSKEPEKIKELNDFIESIKNSNNEDIKDMARFFEVILNGYAF